MHPREAAAVFPDRLFARRIAVATCLLTAIAVGGAIGIALANPARAAARTAPHETVRADNQRYVQWELDTCTHGVFSIQAAGSDGTHDTADDLRSPAP